MFSPSTLWKAPEVNPLNQKARSIPVLNPINLYGRVFFFSWFGFFIAFWSWFAFPPLLSDVIAKDIGLTKIQVSNSNIIALAATLIVRLVAGPCCDRFGPRWTFAGTLLIGAIPTFLSGTAYTVSQLYALRFFIGILGGSFVPCQVWTTGFFDKNVVGTANALTGGWGNSGGGVTYFVMPAVYFSLMDNSGLSSHVAWRVAFIVPGILITATAIALILLTPDTPTGKWADRGKIVPSRQSSDKGAIVDVPGSVDAEGKKSGTSTPIDEEKKDHHTTHTDAEAQTGDSEIIEVQGEIIQKPSFSEMLKVIGSPSTLALGATYFCSFGGELAMNGILGQYYQARFGTKLGLQTASNWAAMFGLMNIITRPLGGLVSDLVYKYTKSLWAKKMVLHAYVLIAAAFLLAIGFSNPTEVSTLVCLIGIGFAWFLEGANGLTFGLVPHVHPYANGIVSGFTGAMGNLGGIVFAIVFRYTTTTTLVKGVPTAGTDFAKAIWIIGVIMIAMQVAVCWIRPIPKGQIGGH